MIWSDREQDLCGEPTPIGRDGIVGLCRRPAGHEVFRGSTVGDDPKTVADLFTDAEMHEATLAGMAVKWTEPDELDHREIRTRQIERRS